MSRTILNPTLLLFDVASCVILAFQLCFNVLWQFSHCLEMGQNQQSPLNKATVMQCQTFFVAFFLK